MSSAVSSVPQKRVPGTVAPNGTDGRSGPSVECGRANPDLGVRQSSLAVLAGAAGLVGAEGVAVAAPPGAALGTYGNSSSGVKSASAVPPALALVERFRLQSAARGLLPLEGVAGCLRRRQGGKDFVDLWYLPEASRARFGGLQTCSSVWACPVCSAKITERRRLEVREAIDAWAAALRFPFGWHPPMSDPPNMLGGDVVLATFTVRHKSSDKLRELVRGLRRALGRLTAGREGQKLRSLYGFVASVRSIEVTWGEANGFHPHCHMLIFVEPGCPFDLLWLHLRKQWDSALRLEGMREVTDRGVDLKWANADVAEYVAKMGVWDIEHELAKGPMKLGRGDSLTPPQLLRRHADAPQELDRETGEVRWSRWGRLWREYAGEMKGVRQLQWTPGFRGSLGLVQEKTDEVLAEETDKAGILLARLDHKEWATVLHFDARAELLNVAAAADPVAVGSFLFELDLSWASEKQERAAKRAPDRRTDWDERKEADAEEMGLTRSEYLAWRSSGAAGLSDGPPVAPVEPGEPAKGNYNTLLSMCRRVGELGRQKCAAFSLADLPVSSAGAEDDPPEERNAFGERFKSL